MGLGGLGHMGVKFANAFGAEVVLFTTSANKIEDGRRLGAHEVVVSKNATEMKEHQLSIDFTLAMVGAPEKPLPIEIFGLLPKRRQIAGSSIGGTRETEEMLDFCAAHNITSDVEVIRAQQINDAYERLLKSDVKYRFVIDTASLK